MALAAGRFFQSYMEIRACGASIINGAAPR